ncbi:hypothetical protein BGZ61DRAFT_197313 [Ilyonectria robusta]|uniref:uncharacterized protein n=1 Tax=Ilyonectria robusta TaxID=1079257 RepID=UPI001E8EBD41|nr:uncharacterized protein BGZ61DRAFT_197313 [Ilyonectria robusta]KAH8721953.1 hypothetical protein BGZ61DRAFT_197313 [Ilyonectria robusta]
MRQPVASLPADPAKRSLPPSRFPISECSIAPITIHRVFPHSKTPPPKSLDGQSSSAALGSTASRPVAWFWPMDASHATLRPCVRSCTPASRCGRAVRDERLHLAEPCYCAA